MENNKKNYAFARDVMLGLNSMPKRLQAKYIYDEAGSKLFEDIMNLPEYYLTRSEFEIISDQKNSFANAIGDEPFNLVELGAGSGEKTQILLNHFLDKGLNFEYVPIDISESAVEQLLERFTEELPDLKVNGLVKDYFDGLRWLKNNSNRRNFILFMGANIGNLNPVEIKNFLQSLWLSLQNKDLLCIGFDLKKDYKLIKDAYDDKAGVTRAFNLNLLKRINNELGGNFNLTQFDHYSTYNPILGANESYLISLADQSVHIAAVDKTFHFDKWEPIHTEYSFKFSIGDIEKMAQNNGYQVLMNLFDQKSYFVDSIWQVYK